MKLQTKKIEKQLASNTPDSTANKPYLKLFNPTGAGTWLISEYDPKNEMMFGLCDLGAGCPELGYVDFKELKEYKGRFGLGIERDLHFTPKKSLQEYANDAQKKGEIDV